MFVFHPKSDDLAPKPLTAIKLVTLTIENPLYYMVENQPPQMAQHLLLQYLGNKHSLCIYVRVLGCQGFSSGPYRSIRHPPKSKDPS